MPNPEAGSFNVLTPKGPGVRVGEELKFTLAPQAQLEFRVQAIERVLLRIPFAGLDYANELKRVGLEKLDLKLPWSNIP